MTEYQELPPEKAVDVRRAFFAGAAGFYALVMAGMDDDQDGVTAENMDLMRALRDELKDWGQQFDAEFMPTAGNA